MMAPAAKLSSAGRKRAIKLGHTRPDRAEDHVGDLSDALGTDVTDLYDDLGIGVVEVVSARPCNDRPGLADNLGASGNLDGAAHEIDTCIEEDDLAASVLCENPSVSKLQVSADWDIPWRRRPE